MKKTRTILGVLSCVLLLQTCGAPQAEQQEQTEKQQSSEQVEQSQETSEDTGLIGQWDVPAEDSIKRMIVFKDQAKWQYFKDGVQVEKGTYHIDQDVLTLKHIVDKHEHVEGEDHEHPADHHYHYSFDENKNQLIFIAHGDTSVYTRIIE